MSQQESKKQRYDDFESLRETTKMVERNGQKRQYCILEMSGEVSDEIFAPTQTSDHAERIRALREVRILTIHHCVRRHDGSTFTKEQAAKLPVSLANELQGYVLDFNGLRGDTKKSKDVSGSGTS